jgi:uncharacterized membrane protein YidH (DUF202 family)
MRPDQVFDPMLQHERTALAWERSAVATMVSGTLLARQAAQLHVAFAVMGVLQVVLGSGVLVWTGLRYEQLHAPLRRGESPVHPLAVKIVGITTIVFSGLAMVIAVATVLV